VLGMQLKKSKKVTTSNWANRRLTPDQLQYAADDAQAGLAVYLAMGCPSVERESLKKRRGNYTSFM